MLPTFSGRVRVSYPRWVGVDEVEGGEIRKETDEVTVTGGANRNLYGCVGVATWRTRESNLSRNRPFRYGTKGYRKFRDEFTEKESLRKGLVGHPPRVG